MRKSLVAVAVVAVMVLGAGAALADSHQRVVELWKCEVKEGKTMEDVEAANSKWVEHVNASVEGGDISSYILTTIVGKQEMFIYADSFPSIAAWEGSREAMKTDEGKAVDKELQEAADCSSNSLYRSTKS